MNTKQQITSLAVILLTSIGTHAATVTWTAASGLFPDQITPAYTLLDTASPENPILTSVLTLSGDTNSEVMLFEMNGADITMPAHLVIEFRMRYVSGSSSVNSRAPGSVVFVTSPQVGNGLWIGPDTIFLLNGVLTKGPEAAVDTDGALHTYRIEVAGTGPGSAVSVFQDNNLVLNGVSFMEDIAGNFGPNPLINFGEGSVLAQGVTEWESFSHNAASVPEPGSILLLLSGVSVASIGRRRTRNERNG